MEIYWVAAVLVVAGVFFVALGYRARTAHQWRTSWNAYAEREIARQRRKQSVQRKLALFSLVETSVAVCSPAPSDQDLSEEKV